MEVFGAETHRDSVYSLKGNLVVPYGQLTSQALLGRAATGAKLIAAIKRRESVSPRCTGTCKNGTIEHAPDEKLISNPPRGRYQYLNTMGKFHQRLTMQSRMNDLTKTRRVLPGATAAQSEANKNYQP